MHGVSACGGAGESVSGDLVTRLRGLLQVSRSSVETGHMPLPSPSSLRPARLRRTALAVSAAAGCLIPLVAAAPSSGAVRPVSSSSVRAAGALPTAAVYHSSVADRRMARALSNRAVSRLFGTHFSGTVLDVETNHVIWSRYGGTGRLPASTTKLVTATNALNLYGPDHRFTTTVVSSYGSAVLTLVGSGDPSLSTADLRVLAEQSAAQVKAAGRSSVLLGFDDHLFAPPSLASGWKRTYVPSDVRWVRALVVDGHHAADTSLDAATVFAGLLRAQGIAVPSVRRSYARAGSPVVASVQGDRLDAIVRQMMLVSDNDHAEALHRLVAVGTGRPATWAGAALAQRSMLARDGITLSSSALRDGSGLSRADRLTSTQLAFVVDNILEPEQTDLAILRDGGLPVAGRTGTLRASLGRFSSGPARCAAGKVVAKTGSLSDAVTLAGYTRGADGRLKAFAFVVNFVPANRTIRQRVDLLAATVNGCY
jgi:D-alanyl-D-alanine carboxypeptidase/D-alanyl-D-alanine-endopeptidase (penicillin-binding protein 4)